MLPCGYYCLGKNGENMKTNFLKNWILGGLVGSAILVSGCNKDGPQNKPADGNSDTLEDTLPKETHAFVGKTSSTAQTEELIENLSVLIKHVTDNDYSKGIVMAVVTPEGISYRGFGDLANEAHPEEINFQLGSITKAFTGMALASMVNDKVVSLDTTISECAPKDFKFSKGRDITLKQLATHTSGLPMDMPGVINSSSEFYSNVSARDLWDNLAHTGISTKGTYKYSNYGIALLGSALANCDGEASWEDVVTKRVSKVMGLDNIKIDVPVTAGYDFNGKPAAPWSWEPHRDAGAHAALRGNAKDLARLAQMSMTADDFYGHNTLTTSFTPLKKITQQVTTTNSKGNHHVGYSWLLGFNPFNAVSELYKDDTLNVFDEMVVQGGSSNTHETWFTFSPYINTGIILLNNSSFSEPTQYLLTILYGVANGYEPDDFSSLISNILPKTFAMDNDRKKIFQGEYELKDDTLFVTMTITLDADFNLWGALDYHDGEDKVECQLWPISSTSLYAHNCGMQFDFIIDEEKQMASSCSMGSDEDQLIFVNKAFDNDGNSETDDGQSDLSDGNSDAASDTSRT